MGFSSQGIILEIIDGGYGARFRMSQLYQRKMDISNQSMSLFQSLVARMNGAIRTRTNETAGLPPDRRVTPDQITGDAREQMRKEMEAQLLALKNKESEIDQELEVIKAKGQALGAQVQEFQKYVAEGLKMTFKNNYA